MEEVMIFVQEKLPIIIAYMLVLAECVGQVFLKKFTKKHGREQQSFVVEKANEVKAIREEMVKKEAAWDKEREEWQKEKAEMRQNIAAQTERINKIEKALKVYIRRSNKDSPS